MTVYAPIPGIRVHTLGGRFPTITTLPVPCDSWNGTYEQAWKRLCAQNPKLHDGPIWSASRVSATHITVTPDRYKRLAIQADPNIGDLGVRIIGAKGLTTRADGCTLIARRGPHTRIYSGYWEFAPAGGVDANAPLSLGSVARTLVQEAAEELDTDISATVSHTSPFMLIEDEMARSVDILATVHWPDARYRRDPSFAAAPPTWEYNDVEWLCGDGLTEWHLRRSYDLTPPTRALLAVWSRAPRGLMDLIS
ncbi:MAG TPA: hypothetical protein VFF65_13625 [Phycisphaerales bacterium]|nr:hypothetical protein [Phycisphaerales bacterium]